MESHMKHLCCSSFKSEGMMSAREVDMIHDQRSQSTQVRYEWILMARPRQINFPPGTALNLDPPFPLLPESDMS